MEFYAEKVFFKTDTYDPHTNLPIYVFDSNYLPKINDTGYDKQTTEYLIIKSFKKVIPRVPNHPYVVTCFTSGFKNVSNGTNSWVYMLKCYQLLPEDLRNNLKKVYIIHESWLVRSFIQILQNVLSIKYFKTISIDGGNYDKLIYCKNLTELSRMVDLPKMRISLDVYLYDTQFTERLTLPATINQSSKVFQGYKDLIIERVIQRLLAEGDKVEMIFTKPGNQKKLTILLDAIARMNYLDLSQWDIYVMGTIFLHLLRTYKKVLIPIELIPLPISDDFSYTSDTFRNIIAYHNDDGEAYELISKVFELMKSSLLHADVTKHDVKSLSKTIGPAITQEKISLENNDKILICQRFMKNLLEHWDSISRSLSSRYIENIDPGINYKKQKVPDVPPPRKTSYSAQPITIKKRSTPRELPQIPGPRDEVRNVSESSKISIGNEMNMCSESLVLKEDHRPTRLLFDKQVAETTEKVNSNKALSNITSSLNKLSEDTTLKYKRKPAPVVTKFSDGYSSITGESKVSKLARLYEERLQGLEIMNRIEK